MKEDARMAATRRRLERALRVDRGDPEDEAQRGPSAGGRASLERAAMVETAIQQAIRRGDFDDLPGAGKPLPGLGGTYDPDWWIKHKIETEHLHGLGPPAIMLRVENAELESRLDGVPREAEVREALEDFNKRVIEARRQLLGGPPVVTPTRDIEAEVLAWRERRQAPAPEQGGLGQPDRPRHLRRGSRRRRRA